MPLAPYLVKAIALHRIPCCQVSKMSKEFLNGCNRKLFFISKFIIQKR